MKGAAGTVQTILNIVGVGSKRRDREGECCRTT